MSLTICTTFAPRAGTINVEMTLGIHAELPSWNDTATRTAIFDYVTSATDSDSDHFVPEPERVAVFDNDGTLWSEKPIPIQLDFTLFRMAEQAEADPSLARPPALQGGGRA